PYPSKEEMGQKWVDENVGVREFVISPKDVGSYSFQAGNLVEFPGVSGPERAFAAGEGDAEDGSRVVELADGRFVSKYEVYFVVQPYAILVFYHENWSRNVKSAENFLYMKDAAIREQYFESKVDSRRGL